MIHPEIHQIEKLKFLGATSNGRAAAEGLQSCSCRAPPGWSAAARHQGPTLLFSEKKHCAGFVCARFLISHDVGLLI